MAKGKSEGTFTFLPNTHMKPIGTGSRARNDQIKRYAPGVPGVGIRDDGVSAVGQRSHAAGYEVPYASGKVLPKRGSNITDYGASETFNGKVVDSGVRPMPRSKVDYGKPNTATMSVSTRSTPTLTIETGPKARPATSSKKTPRWAGSASALAKSQAAKRKRQHN